MNTIFRNFLLDRRVAALKPTSRRIVEKVCRLIDFRRDLTVLEYGPGDGVFTKALLSRLSSDSRLVAVEINQNFIKLLSQMQDSRLIIRPADVRQIKQVIEQLNLRSGTADYIISGIPFSFLNRQEREQLINQSFDLLTPGGRLIIYQFLPVIRRQMKQRFSRLTTKWQWFNLPPLVILTAEKLLNPLNSRRQ